MTVPVPAPGTVLAVRAGSWTGTLIRLGAALRGRPNLSSHIAVMHHTDAEGTPWAVEGRPGGAGWADIRPWLADPHTITNTGQPLTPAQRDTICTVMTGLLGTAYDWQAIAADAAADLGWTLPGWKPAFGQPAPGALVCSSLAAYAYAKAGVPHPAGDRGCQPADWDDFIITRGWEHP